MNLKFTEELCVMTMKNNASFKEEFTCHLKTDMKNLTNFDLSTRKSKTLHFSQRIYRIFIVLMLYLIWLKKFSSSIYYYSFNANRFLEEVLEIGKIKST